MTSEKAKPLDTTKKTKTALAIVITVLFIIAVEYFIGFKQILAAWQKLSLLTIVIAFFLLFLSYVIRATRIYSYYTFSSRKEFVLCTKATLLHNFYNNFLPMRAGELSFPILLKQYFSISLPSSVGALLLFRILDLHVLISISLFCIIFLFPAFTIAIVFAIIVWSISPFILYKLKKPLERKLDNASSNKLSSILNKILVSLPETQRQLAIAYFWTAFNWIIKLLVLSWIFLQFQPLPMEVALVSIIAGDLTSVLPIHGVAGAGTYEAGVLFGASLFQTDPKTIVAAAINLHLFILGSSAIALAATPFLPNNKKA